jgi:pimeloyl-ACP methyl ester carboxylesterase
MRRLVLLQCLLLMCFPTSSHGSPGERRYTRGNEPILKETRDYLRSKFRRGSSSQSFLGQSQKDTSRSFGHPDPTPTVLARDERYVDEYRKDRDQISESPGLFSNYDRLQDEDTALADMYRDDDDDDESFFSRSFFGFGGTSKTTRTTNKDVASLQSPVVYRYYSRNRARDVAAGSIPFILLGPNVDHWKVAGQQLAARGFSVMAVERVRDEQDDSFNGEGDYSSGPRYDANLILELLEALRWSKVVLVGCDSESALAIRAAMKLAPDRVVGLVLCGNLEAADDFVANMYPQNRRLPASFAVDRFLHSNLLCPFQVVWDGDVPAMPHFSGSGSDTASSEPLQTSHRSLVLGGGSAPHRRRPELFAWVLTRFVEEKIAPTQVSRFKVPRARARGDQQTPEQKGQKPSQAPTNFTFLSLSEFLSPESLVVWGRVVASMLFYAIVLKLAIFQYESVRGGIFSIKAGIEAVSALGRHILGAVPAFLGGLGSVSFLSRGDDKSRDDTESEPETAVPAEEEEEEQEEEKSLAPSPAEEEKQEENIDSEDVGEEEEPANIDSEDVGEEEEPANAPYFKPSFFLDRVIA